MREPLLSGWPAYHFKKTSMVPEPTEKENYPNTDNQPIVKVRSILRETAANAM